MLGVSFKPLEDMKVPDFGTIYAQFEPTFPIVEEHPLYIPPIEPFGPAALSANLSIDFGSATIPRLWFLSRDQQQLVQLQRNWLAFNWRKVGPEAEYQRWGSVRKAFSDAYSVLDSFALKRGLGSLSPVQCEVSYINQIEMGGTEQSAGDISQVLRLAGTAEGGFLPPAEQMSLQSQYVMSKNGAPIGRLHVSAQPAVRRSDSAPILILTLTARGKPLGSDRESVLDFLDIASEWVVEGFAAITTPQMHDIWVREK